MACLWVMALALPGLGQESVSLYKGRVTFTPPAGLRPLSREAIARDYQGRVPPQHVYKNATGDVAIAFNHLPKKVSQDSLQAFRDRLESDLKKKMEVVEWVSTSFQTLHGVRWFQLQFKTVSDGFTVQNIVLGTPMDGRLLEVSFNTFADFDPMAESELVQSRLSLKLLPAKILTPATPGSHR
ncbi:MAG: hypothetical protein HY319_10270 [Armatimonadetes bacterium]|nr:hypothetical protein [Armatimonadota bacterium]